MAIYHLSVKPICRSAGRSATGAAAYRAACKIIDERTGLIHNYTRKRGVESADIVLPFGAPAWASIRSALWNAAEAAETRKDACIAREYEVALPAELSLQERHQLALDFAQEMADREGCAVDVAIHKPGRGGDNRNYHAHILRSTRKILIGGMGDKLDTEKAGRNRRNDLNAVRERWAFFVNERLSQHGHAESVDHRTLERQGIDRLPTIHLGPSVHGMAKRGIRSVVQARIDSEVALRLLRARELGERDRVEKQMLYQGIVDISGDLSKAKASQKIFQSMEKEASQIKDFSSWLAVEKSKYQSHQSETRKPVEPMPFTPDFEL